MPYGTIKVDNIVFTNSGVDQTVTVSGIVQSVSGNLTVTGTISGNLIRGTTVSGATITGGVLSVTSGIFTSGTVGAPTIGFRDDSNTGFWSPAGDVVALSTGGSERIRIDSDGDLGVGTSSPTSRLTVRADAASGPNTIIRVENRAVSAGATTQNIKIEGIFDYNNGTSDASAGAILFGKEGTYTTATTANDSYLAFETVADNSSAERVRINSVGQLITTSLGTAAAPAVVIGNDVNSGLYSPGADQVAISTAGTGRLFVEADGRVGLGAGPGSYKLDVQGGGQRILSQGATSFLEIGNGTATNQTAFIDLTTDTTYTDYGLRLIRDNAGANAVSQLENRGTGELSLRCREAAPLTFYTTNTERARIDSSGRLLVGTSSTPPAVDTIVPRIVSSSNIGVTGAQDIAIYNFQNAVGSGRTRVGPKLFLGRSRSGTNGSLGGIIINGDMVGNIRFAGDDGTQFLTAAEILAEADGTPGADDMPGRLVFSTTADGASTPTERLRITSTGNVGIGTSAPGHKLDVAGSGTQTIRVLTTDTSGAAVGILRAEYLGGGGGANTSVDLRAGDAYAFLTATTNHPLLFGTNSTERARIDSSGRLLVGTSSAYSVPTGDGGIRAPGLQRAATTFADSSISSTLFNTATEGGGTLTLSRSNTTTLGAQVIAAAQDATGSIWFSASDGVTQIPTASIVSRVDGTPGLNDMPGRLVFSTTADGAASPTERMRITSAGNVGIGTTAPVTSLDVTQYANTTGIQITSIEKSSVAQGGISGAEFIGSRGDTNATFFGRVCLGFRRNSGSEIASGTGLGGILFGGQHGIATTYDSASTRYAASIVGISESIFTNASTMSTGIAFRTGSTGEDPRSPNLSYGTERLRIDSAGTTTLTSAAATAPFIAKISTTEVARIDSSGRLLVGTSAARINFFNAASGQTSKIQVEGLNYQDASFAVICNANSADKGVINFAKSRATAIGGNTIIANNDDLGEITFQGADGGEFVQAAGIKAQVDGTPGLNDMPGRLVFSTTADGAASPTERMRIDSAGRIGVGGTAGTDTAFALLGVARGTGSGNYGYRNLLEIPSTTTSSYTSFESFPATAASAFTLTNLINYDAGQGTFGVGSTVTNQYGFFARAGLVGATNNFGFYSNIAAATGRWNFYCNGTADSYFNSNNFIFANGGTEKARVDSSGRLLVGTSTAANTGLVNIAGDISLYTGGTTVGRQATYALGVSDNGTTGQKAQIAFAGAGTNGFLTNITFSNFSGDFFNASLVERARIDSSGRLLVGTSTALPASVGTETPIVQLVATSPQLMIARRFADAVPAHFIIGKSRGTANEIALDGDNIGLISFQGSDGTNLVRCAEIRTQIDGTPGANDMPGRLVFSTTADGAATPTERMRISNDGRHTIGANIHQGTALTTTAPAKLYISPGTYTDTTTAISGTVTHGTIVAFDNPAIAATNTTVTYTNASTVYIDGAPTNGTNVTITNPFALFVAAGASRFGGNVLSSSATGGIGYATGAGSTQTQATSRTQGVTINNICGAITLFSAAGTTAWQSFTVTNSTVAATDNVIVNQKSGTDLYMIHVTNVAAGSFRITYATTGGTTTEQPVFNFSVIKAVAA